MDDHVGQFLHYLSVEKGSSANTIAAYGNDLAQFRGFLNASGKGNHGSWSVVNRAVIIDYITELKGRKYAEATVARKVAAIKAFFAFLHQVEGIVKQNPTENVGFRVPKSLPKPLSIKEIDELLEQPARSATPESKRDKAMLEIPGVAITGSTEPPGGDRRGCAGGIRLVLGAAIHAATIANVRPGASHVLRRPDRGG